MKPEDTIVGPDHNKVMRQRMQRAAECDAKVREVQKNRPGLSYAEAWMIAKGENPELFQGEKEQVPAAKAGNELASRARALGCAQVVQAVQASHPGLSFDECWRIAAVQNKQLFEGSISDSSAAGYAEFQDRCDALGKKLDALIERNNSGSGAVVVVGIRQEVK